MGNKFCNNSNGWIFIKVYPTLEVRYGSKNMGPRYAERIIPVVRDVLNKLHCFLAIPANCNNVVSIRNGGREMGRGS